MEYTAENYINDIDETVGLTISAIKTGHINCDDQMWLHLIEFTNGKFIIITDQASWTTNGAFGCTSSDLDQFLPYIDLNS